MSTDSPAGPRIIALVALSQHKIPGSGSAVVLEANNTDEQDQITTEIAKALKADVLKLSNGINVLLKS